MLQSPLFFRLHNCDNTHLPDAALAYDSAIRARELKEHYRKINFDTQEDYLEAREIEMKNRGNSVDLEETLVHLINSVKAFREQLASKQEKPLAGISSLSEDTTETNMVVEQEDAPLVVSSNPTDRQLRPRKKQKLENGVSVVDSVSTSGNVYSLA